MRFVPPTATFLLALLVHAGCGGEEPQRALPPAATPVQGVSAQGAIAQAPAPPLVQATGARRADAEEAARRYERNDRARVPRRGVAPFLPLYRLAAEHYELDWRLLAAIHKQETAFSTAEGTYHGLNFAGCCAGPMQFNLKNKPVSTWKRFGNAFRMGPPRPAAYPHRTRTHPSPYDDWDAIIAAARLLDANGAGPHLDGRAWSAAYLYYGPGDLTADDYGVTYADEVIARALSWQRRGFCPQCTTPRGLVAAVHAKYAPPLRESDEEAEERRKREARERRARRRRARERRERRERAAERRAAAERVARRRRSEQAERERQPSAAREHERKAPSGGAPQSGPPATQGRPQQPAQTQTQPSPPPQTAPPSQVPGLPQVDERAGTATQPSAPGP